MSLRQFEYFVAVAEEGSLSRAAARLCVAQPSLSQQLKALERRVGGALFERLPRGMQLTPAGRAFLPEALATLRGAERAYRSARAAVTGESAELHIATVSSVAAGVLPDVIRSWHDQHPQCPVRLEEFSHRDLLEEQVRNGLGDLAIGPRPRAWDGPVLSLGHEEFVIVLPYNHPLLDENPQNPGTPATAVDLHALAGEAWVLFGQGHGLNDLIAGYCSSQGFRPMPAVRTWQVDAAARLAAAGVGPALLPDNAVPAGLDAAVLPCRPKRFRELTCYLRSQPHGLVHRFLTLLQDTAPLTQPTDS
ncbi:LysR family transcriptional regulator [Streptomyces anandii]|uniref:LysR family transcriptional regulator n=1 Tax=Streptomyces anandii TaxID=285454 RepID=UPI001677CBB3|nr:LysR family transcriptional regulator [Streptomyces anandii]GGY12089.1 LysR family transcriptional regulator [Streptomyces anandii JCM 4720]